MTEYCSVADCERPVFRLGLCAAHCKRKQRGQPVSSAPIAAPLTPRERALEASIALVECGDDDAEFRRRERVWLSAVRAYSEQARSELIRQGLEEAMSRGVSLGRPPKLDPKLLDRSMSISALARLYRVDRNTIRSALRRGGR